jgi:hypothetical protein
MAKCPQMLAAKLIPLSVCKDREIFFSSDDDSYFSFNFRKKGSQTIGNLKIASKIHMEKTLII